jgi:hypothetical protein
MTLSATRALVQVSMNPTCELLGAMAVEHVDEKKFFRRATGFDYPGEFGERLAARRRGAKFEENLHRNDAALLRQAVGSLYRLDPETLYVRNLAAEVPGPRDGLRAVRLHRTWTILRDLAAGRPVPDIVIQPQFSIPTGSGPGDFEYVTPDFVILDPRQGIYVPGEEKSFIVRDGVADRADLDRTRRQAAAQILALRAEASRVGLENRVLNRAVFVFATPFGLRPAPAFEEYLHAEVFEIERAIRVLGAVRARLNALRVVDPAPLHVLLDELPINFQERCLSTCVMAPDCQSRCAGSAITLGDQAAELVGPDMDADRIAALALGEAAPATPQEAELASRLTDAALVLGRRPRLPNRRSA